MRCRHFSFTLSVLVLLPLSVCAQKNFLPGTIVTSNGDSIAAAINVREWQRTPSTIEVRNDEMGVREFSANQLRFFEVKGQVRYHAFTLPISMNVADYRNPEFSIDARPVTQTVFLKEIRRGKNVSLFRYDDEIKTRLFIRKIHDDVPKELLYFIFRRENEGGLVRHVRSYGSELITIANSLNILDSKLERKINRIRYTEIDLAEVVDALNQEGKEVAKIENKGKTSFYAGAGVDMSKLSYAGNFEMANADTKTPLTANPYICLGVDAFQNKFIRRLRLGADVILMRNSLNATNVQTGDFISSTYRHSVDRILFSPGLSLSYCFYYAASVKVYGGIGMRGIFVLNDDAEYRLTRTYAASGNTFTQTNANYPQLNKDAIMLALKAGVYINNHYEVRINCLPSYHIAREHGAFSVLVSTIQVGMNYHF